MKTSIAIQVLPHMQNTEETIRVVDAVIDYIQSTGLNYYVGPCETAIEGDDFHQLMEIAENCVYIAEKAGSPKVSVYMKMSYAAQGSVLTIDEKVTKHHK